MFNGEFFRGVLAVVLMAGVAGLSAIMTAGAQTPSAPVTRINIGYIKQAVNKPLPLSRLDNPLDDDGLAGAKLALEDNNTSGKFLKQEFVLKEVLVPADGDAEAAAKSLVAEGILMIVLDAPAATVLKISDALRDTDALLFNVSAPDTDLRDEKCRPNVLHTLPSRDMLADGLAQYFIWKKWTKWFLVYGALPDDILNADAIRRAAKRFGAKIIFEKEYKEAGGARRTDSGHEQIQAQMPVFTQDAPEHDILVVADENEVFGPYVPYRNWTPRPVAGTSGLSPASWHPAHEQWGATQFQNRFNKLAKRGVRPIDYHAWLAVRSVGEAVTRVKSADAKALRQYIKSPEFGLAAFKGQKLTYRAWNGQLRHAVVVADRHIPVSWSPQPGFLHQVTPLDTLGVDQPESKCRL